MDQFLRSFQNKKSRYGTFSVLSVVLVLAILIAVNLVASSLDLRWDLTSDKLYSLSKESISVLDTLETDVTIYALFKTGEEVPLYQELLEQYQAKSSRVKLSYKDPYLHPQFAGRYAAEGQKIEQNSIIVEGSGGRYKVIPAEDLVTTTYTYDSWPPQEVVSGIELEPEVTNAILYVTSASTPIVYMIKNHGETPLSDSIAAQLSKANYVLKDLDLLREETIPEDCTILLATTPQRDWTEAEAGKVRDYLERGGRAMFMMYSLQTAGSLTQVNQLLNSYGVSVGQGLVIEGDKRNYYEYPYFLIPNYARHDITQPIIDKQYIMLMAYSTSVDILDVKRQSLTIEPLLTTSREAYARTDLTNDRLARTGDDLSGPFMLAAAITDGDVTYSRNDTKIVVASCGELINEMYNQEVIGTNGDFILYSMNWLNDTSNTVYVRSKTGSAVTSLTMTAAEEDLLFYLALIGLPVVILGIGLYVWYGRRYS